MELLGAVRAVGRHVLVRLRRPEVPTALSLCQFFMKGGMENLLRPAAPLAIPGRHQIFGMSMYNSPDAIYALPKPVYGNLSCLQKAVWAQRELEARHQYAMRHVCKGVDYLEVEWDGSNFDPVLQKFFGEYVPELGAWPDARKDQNQHVTSAYRQYLNEHMEEARAQVRELDVILERVVPWAERGWNDWHEGDLD
eukprot:TRINITY_DN8774_c0_g1_i1.p2 TRINITY_DN8774_c0_g1~~TRINITY_DN8774_c0_g1_i1.p2  ORF type:complete len:195 (+),score=16.09 TRINITY_DN8774_c0_g1_i1:709-1293(+)